MAGMFSSPPDPPKPPDPNKARRKAEAEAADKRRRATGYASTIVSNQLGLKETLGG